MDEAATLEPLTDYVRPDVRAMLDFRNAQAAPDLSELPLAEARGMFAAMAPFVEAPARELARIADLSCPGPAGPIPLRLYDARARREPSPVVLFMHGGGFVIGDLDSHHSLCTEIAATLDLPVIAVDYRLAPEHPFPAAPDDCEAAARWIAGAPAEIEFTPTGLITMGDSAGGNLTLVVTRDLMARPAKVPVVLQVPIYPVASDISGDASFQRFAEGHVLSSKAMVWFDEAYRAPVGHDRYHVSHLDHDGTPPSIVVTASLDPLRDSGRGYAAALARAGCDVTFMEMRGTVHGFVNMRLALPSAQVDLARILAAVKLHLGNPG